MFNLEQYKGARVQVQNLRKKYGDFVAVSNVDMDIAPGEFVTLLGPSGSGKTTTLNIVAGFEKQTSGDVLVNGRSMKGVATSERNFGMVFQNYSLFPHMTVEKNIAYPLRWRGIRGKKAKELVAQALKIVHLEKFAARYPNQLSGGQQQRVALARAVVYQPHLLLMDEPLSALDKNLREAMQEEIREIHKGLGTTVLYVTHDQEEALSLSDKIAIYNKGRIEQIGTGRELYETPVSLFVAQFMGDSTLLNGFVDIENPHLCNISSETIPIYNTANASGSVSILLRPEWLTINATKDEKSYISAEVKDDVYIGHSRRIIARTADGTDVLVRHDIRGSADIAIGQKCYLGWDIERALVFQNSI